MNLYDILKTSKLGAAAAPDLSTALRAQALNKGKEASSWTDFRKLVRAGKAPELYPVGTKLYENWGDDSSNAWIVVDYPDDSRYIDSELATQGYTNRVMLIEEKINYLRSFDAKEAWLYAETAIPAGMYRFTIPNYDTTYGGNKTYYS